MTSPDEVDSRAARRGPQPSNGVKKPQRPRRQAYDAAFKLKVVYEALKRPAGARIKPTCREYPDIEPVQLRKWIRNLAALELAVPQTKCRLNSEHRVVRSPVHDGADSATDCPPSPPSPSTAMPSPPHDLQYIPTSEGFATRAGEVLMVRPDTLHGGMPANACLYQQQTMVQMSNTQVMPQMMQYSQLWNSQAIQAHAINQQAMNAHAINQQAMNAQAAINAQAMNAQAMNAQAMNTQAMNTQAMMMQQSMFIQPMQGMQSMGMQGTGMQMQQIQNDSMQQMHFGGSNALHRPIAISAAATMASSAPYQMGMPHVAQPGVSSAAINTDEMAAHELLHLARPGQPAAVTQQPISEVFA